MARKVLVIVFIAAVVAIMVAPSMIAKPVYAPCGCSRAGLTLRTFAGATVEAIFQHPPAHGEFPSEPHP